MQKAAIRKKYLQERSQLSDKNIEEFSLAIANHLLHMPIWDKDVFHVFCSIPGKQEVDTEILMTLLMGKNKQIVVPKMLSETIDLEHYLLTEETIFQPNNWGIPEPKNGKQIKESAIEVVFVPLLAVDQQGHRVGYGKGFYDRFLAKCSPTCIKIGIGFWEPIGVIEDITPTDIALNTYVCPKGIWKFESNPF